MKTLSTVLAALLATLFVMGDARVARADADVDVAARRQQVLQRIREVRAQKLTRALGLDQTTRDRLLPVLERYDRELARLARESHGLKKQARALVKSGAADAAASAELDRLLDRMIAVQRQLWDRQEARFREVRKVLTPQQAAAIFVVLPRLDRKLHKHMRRALQGDHRGLKHRGKGR